jgi:hypothetical protein
MVFMTSASATPPIHIPWWASRLTLEVIWEDNPEVITLAFRVHHYKVDEFIKQKTAEPPTPSLTMQHHPIVTEIHHANSSIKVARRPQERWRRPTKRWRRHRGATSSMRPNTLR